MAMSKKHYNAIAEVIRKANAPGYAKAAITKGLADVMALDSGAFDRRRFYAACDLKAVSPYCPDCGRHWADHLANDVCPDPEPTWAFGNGPQG